MDKLLDIYLITTNVVAFCSFVGFVVLVTRRITNKNPFKLASWIILFVTLIGMYLYVPSRLFLIGALGQNIAYLENAVRLSINPYEKRLCWKNMSHIYESQNGNKAIEYLEKALQGEYLKYKEDAFWLAYLYSLKGDYSKTLELNNLLNIKNSLSLRNAYISNGEYEKALNTFSEENKNLGNQFLQADLYKKVGKIKKADLLLFEAQNAYNLKIKEFSDEIDKLKYQKNMDKYKNIDSYKSWLKEQKIQLKFD